MSSTVIFPHATSDCHIIGGVVAVTTSMKSLVSTDGQTRKFGVKKVDEGHISTVKR